MTEDEDGAAVDWRAQLVFPGLRAGRAAAARRRRWPRAARSSRATARRWPRARTGSRTSGRWRPRSPGASARRRRSAPTELARRGVPEGAPVGLNGLEREFDERLSGTPGRHPARRRARRRPHRAAAPAPTCAPRSTPTSSARRSRRSPGRFGGIAVLRPTTGEVLGLSGVAFSAPQPPGSTFKIITLAGALEAGVVKPRAKFPVQTETTLEGVKLQNAHGEACGGSLRQSFADSCNSVFAPLGAKLGAKRLVRPPSASASTRTPGRSARRARRSRRPRRSATTSRSARPRSARARCSPPRSSSPPWRRRSACAAAASPRRSRAASQGKETRATSARTARVVAGFMRTVVKSGTGIGAQVPGVVVAGKTGTAELRSTVNEDPAPLEPGATPTPQPEEDKTDTDAWFVGLRALPPPARRGRGAARRPGRGRRDGRAGGQDGDRGGARPLGARRRGRRCRRRRAAPGSGS